MRIDHLEHIDIKTQAVKTIFGAESVPEENVKKAREGIDDVVKLVTAILAQDVLPHAAKIEDVADITGGDARKMRRNIRNAIKVGRDLYDGTYGRPEIQDADHLVYVVTVLAIRENGRKSADVNRFVAQALLTKFFDVMLIENAYDLMCYALLSTYFEDVLDHGKKPFSRYLDDWGSKFTTRKRLTDLISKQEWFNNINLLRNMNIDTFGPSITQVTNGILIHLERLRNKERTKAEEWELDHLFDEK